MKALGVVTGSWLHCVTNTVQSTEFHLRVVERRLDQICPMVLFGGAVDGGFL